MTLPRLALFSALAVMAMAADHPNFSGTWKLNLAESDFIDKHASAPDSLVLTVRHEGDDFRYDSQREKDGKKSRGHLDLQIGLSIDQSGGTAAAEWKADQLEFKLIYNPGQQNQYDAIETWSLSTDGKKLTSDFVTHLPKNGGEARVRRVFDKSK
jgi:hypothetical protein